MTDNLLKQAIAAIKSGSKSQGKKLLIQVLELDSRNELAWLWLSQCVTKYDQKLDCLNRVLKINPNNSQAKEEIARLQTLSKIKAQPVPSVPRKNKAKSSNSLLYILIIAIVMVCVCVFALAVFSGDIDREDKGGRTLAYYVCQDLIEKRLAAPATADFPSSSEITILPVKDTEKETYQVRGYVDSQNSFGALLRTYYICEVSYRGDGNWHLEYLEFEE